MAKPAKRSKSKAPVVDDIPKDEKWRIINESGLLGKEMPIPGITKKGPADPTNGEDFIFRAILYAIPFTSLYVMLHSLVHRQYGVAVSASELLALALKAAPVLVLYIYYTNANRRARWVQIAITAISTACGCYLLYLTEKSPALGIMRQAPGLATLWIYGVFLLDILPAVAILAVSGIYYFFLIPRSVAGSLR